MEEYILPFIGGGTFIAMNKYISNNISPKLGAIIVTFPIGLFSAYFIISQDKMPKYLVHYLHQVLINLILGLIYVFLFDRKLLEQKTIVMVVMTLWIMLGLIQMVM